MKKVFLFFVASILPCVYLLADEIRQDSSKVFSLQEVEITSVRAGAKTPMAYSNMNKQEIDAANLGQDIPFLLTLTPSVIATADAGTGIGYTGFRVRGTDANRINITTNGIPLNDSESHGVFWVNMPDFASSLQDLQIQRGVGTSTNGAGAFGASINMTTENIPAESYGELDGGYGSFNTAKSTFKLGTGTINNCWAFDGRISSITSDGFVDRASVDLKSYFAQGMYFNENTVLKILTFSGKEKTYHAWNGVDDFILFDLFRKGNRTYNSSGYMGNDAEGNPMYYKNQTDNYRQTHYQLSLIRKITPHLTLNAALHYTKGLGYYEEYKNQCDLAEYGLEGESDLVRQKHMDNDFGGMVFSLNYAKEKWNVSLGGGSNYYDGKHFGKVIWTKTDNNIHHEYYRSTGKKLDANLYLKSSYQITDAISIYGDLQARFIDYTIKGENDKYDVDAAVMRPMDMHVKFNFFNPKAGVFYQINAKNKVYASFAAAHREPTRNNYTEAGTNEFPYSERLLDYELAYKFADKTFSAGLNVYYMQYKDQLVLTGKTSEIGEALTSNVPDSYRAGIEVLLGAKITSNLHWNGNLTLSQNKIKHYAEYVDVDDAPQQADYYGTTRIAYSPDIIANSLLSFHYQSFAAGLQSSYVGKQYLDNTGNDLRSLDACFVSNLRLGYELKLSDIKKLSLSVLINNFFNEEYESNGYAGYGYSLNENGELRPETWRVYFPQAGRHFLTNLTLKF
ncbi:MAG: iron complex outermembrane recepter protein [Candidatus Ordinivivax streblomastigis]|uniref:Iron complex outermembrane recepter protein n=1 Tax=Candidatus Ordinivivax streblomastigis TaxID=2540710 RepID=A0A5M8P4D9_9BACT|nr:MAG: iron complex outermembrane recepter protein [Candidatus Ordinivivax streblomastigis]